MTLLNWITETIACVCLFAAPLGVLWIAAGLGWM